MPCFCRVFRDFFESMPCFLHFFAVIFYCPYKYHDASVANVTIPFGIRDTTDIVVINKSSNKFVVLKYYRKIYFSTLV